MNSIRLSFFLKSITLFAFLAFVSSEVKSQIDFEILSGDAQICIGDSTLLSIDATVDSVTWSPTAGVSMPNSLSTFVTTTMGTTYFATLYSGGLTQVVPLQVDVTSTADLGNNVTVCSNGSSLNYDFSQLPFPGNYAMSSNGGFTITETSNNVFNIDIANIPAGTYDLTVSNPDCNQTDMIQVDVVDGLAAQLNLQEDNRAICLGEEVNFSVTQVAGQTYEWTGNGVVLSSSNSLTDTPTMTTTYVLSAVGVTCTVPTQDSVTITVNTDPSISLPEIINGCENDIIQLGNNIAQVGTTYSWEPEGNTDDNILDNSVVNAELLVVEDGTYILTANNGCEIMDTIEVVMIENDIDLLDTMFVCKGDDATITWTTNPPNDDVAWTTLDGAPLVNVPVPFTVTPDDVVSYIATVENAGCTFSDTITLQVDSLPMNLDIDFIEFNNAPAPICVGDTVQLQTLPVFDETFFPNIEFQWLADGQINSGPSSEYLTPDSLFQLIFIAERTKIYSRINTNGACIDTTEVEVPVVPILAIELSFLDPVCPNSSVLITGTAKDPLNNNEPIDPAEIEWEWMGSPGTIEPAEGLGENTPTASVSNSAMQIMVTATYEGCPSMGIDTINVLSTPQLGFPASTDVCAGQEVMLNNGFVGPDYTFQWSSSNNDLGGQATSANPTVNPLVTTTYSVTVTNGNCEPVEDQITIEVFDAAGSLANAIEASGCIGETITLSLPDDYVGGPESIITWTPQSGGTPITGESIQVQINQNEIYIISVSNNCVDDQFVGQAIVSAIAFQQLNLNFTGCESSGNLVTASIPTNYNGGTNPVYEWVNAAGEVQANGSTVELPSGQYNILLSNDECQSSFNVGSASASIEENIMVTIELVPDTSIYKAGQIVEAIIVNPNPNLEYIWSNTCGISFDLNSTTTSAFFVVPDTEAGLESDVISVTAEDLNGCPNIGMKTYQIDDVDLPNIFTPGLNENNIFRVRVAEGAEITNLQIYDRWGNKVYDNDNAEQEWDGNINGNPAPSEVYIYTVTYQFPGKDPITKSSDLTLIR